MAEPGEVELFEDVEHLDEHHAAARRLVRRDPMAPIGPHQGQGALRAVAREVIRREEASIAREVLGDQVGDRALVENGRPLLRNERAGSQRNPDW